MAKTILDNQGKPIPKNTQGINDGKVAVYNVKTGEASACFPIDAKDRVNTGKWVYEKPAKKKKPEKKTTRAVTIGTDTDN